MRLFVGGLDYSTTDADLRNLFASAGDVTEAKVVTDRETGKSKGFGFVELTTDNGATLKDVVQEFNGTRLGKRTITVNEAAPRAPKSQGAGGRRH